MDLEKIAGEMGKAAREAAAFIRREAEGFDKSQVSDKGLNQLVSYVDVTAEKMLVERLSALLPEAGFITEENTTGGERRELTWIIDPLDGTTNFIHGVPVYSISLALLKNGVEQAGVVYEVSRDECFVAWKEGGAWLNGKQIYVSPVDELKKSLLATGFPYYDFRQMPQYMAVLHDLMKSSHGLRRLGSAAVDLAYVACGRFEGFFEYGLSPWDVAGGAILITEAGGRVTDFSGGNDYLFGRQIIGSGTGIFHEFSTLIRQRMA